MILHVLTDARKIQFYINTGSGQDILWSNTALHQDIGTSNRTCSQNDLLPDGDGGDGAALEPGELDTGGSEVVIENDLRHGSVGQNVQVIAGWERIDVCGT